MSLAVSNKILQVVYVYAKRKKKRKKRTLNKFKAIKSGKYIYKEPEPVGWLFLYEMSELCWQSNNVPE